MKVSFKSQSRRLQRSLLARLISTLDADALARSALVFAPHPDDETLGCGGTIARKRRAGADIGVVFMTDGRSSHRRLMDEASLQAIRAREARAACRVLGLNDDQVIWLGFADGRLRDHQPVAIAKVVELLQARQPAQIFVPYRHEPPPDHFVTYQIVMAALAACQLPATMYEYPIWFWDQWPWTSLRASSLGARGAAAKNSLVAGMRLLREFRYAVDISDVLDCKRAALAQHRSQMERLVPDPGWLTLNDVSKGEFLDCFFQPYELFRGGPAQQAA